jgi:hypothetical protein
MPLVQALEGRLDACVAWGELVELFEIIDGPIRIGSEVLCRHARFAQEVDVLGRVLGADERAVVQGKQLVPARLRVERELEPIEGPARSRAEREHAL